MIYDQTEEHRLEQKMLLNNRIPGLLPVSSGMRDGVRFIEYDENGTAALRERAEEERPETLITEVLRAISAEEEILKNYMIPASALCLSAEEIRFSAGSGEVCFAVDPCRKICTGEALRLLLEYVLKNMDHGTRPETTLMYRLYDRAAEPGAAVNDLIQLIEQVPSEEPVPDETVLLRSPEDEIYTELGLEKAPGSGKYENFNEDDTTGLIEASEREGDDGSSHGGPAERGQTAFPWSMPEDTEADPAVMRETVLFSEKTREKLLDILKNYGFEIGIILITLAGILLILCL